MAGTVIVPWYATGFRADAFERALNVVAAAAMRYGASSYAVYRARDDRYRFQQLAAFDNHLDWARYWAPSWQRCRHGGRGASGSSSGWRPTWGARCPPDRAAGGLA